MIRGTTARVLLTALAAVLMALQLCAPTAASAAARAPAHHLSPYAVQHTAGAKADTKADKVTCGSVQHSESRTTPFRVRDRHRPSQCVLDDHARTPLARDPAAGHDPRAATPAACRATRSSTALSTAVTLQVFRC